MLTKRGRSGRNGNESAPLADTLAVILSKEQSQTLQIKSAGRVQHMNAVVLDFYHPWAKEEIPRNC